MGYVLAAAALAHLVWAHDCDNADTHSLTESYVGRSEGEISMGLRWFYCAGLGIAIACMGMLTSSMSLGFKASFAWSLVAYCQRDNLNVPRS